MTKKEYGYVTFCHPECAKLLANHLRTVEARVGRRVRDPDFPLFYNPRSRSGFYRVNTLEKVWNDILRKLGLDDKIKYPGREMT